MTIFQMAEIASKYDTVLSHAMLHAVAVAKARMSYGQ